jgi:hypothetical protein
MPRSFATRLLRFAIARVRQMTRAAVINRCAVPLFDGPATVASQWGHPWLSVIAAIGLHLHDADSETLNARFE